MSDSGGARLAALVADAGIGVSEIDPRTGRYVSVTPTFCAIAGYRREELLAFSPGAMTHPDDRARMDDTLAALTASHGATAKVEMRFVRGDGRIVWGRLTMSSGGDGEGRSVLALLEDVSERHSLDAELRDSEARARAAADRGEQHLTTVLHATRLGIFITRVRDGAILDVNEAFSKLLGWSRDELVGRTTAEVGLYVAPETRDDIYDELGRTGGVAGIELRARHRSGATRDFVVTAGTIDFAGQRCAIAFWQDVTELRRVDAALKESEADLAAMFDLAPIGIGQVDPRTLRWTRVNGRLSAITGYSPEEMCGLSIADLTHPDDRARDAEIYAQIVRGETQSSSREKRYVRKDGRVVWVAVNLRAQRDPEGAVTRTIATVEDVTERRAVDAALKLQTSALQAAANGIIITDTRGRIQWANEAFSRLTGYGTAELLGSTSRALRSGAQDEAFYRAMWGTILAGDTWQGELVNRRKDGALYREEMTITPVRGEEGGAITHFIAIKQDITERQAQAQALAEVEERHRLALDATELGTWRHEIATDRFILDERAQRHFGLSAPVVSGETMLASIHPEDAPKIRAAIAATISPAGSGRAFTEHRVVLPSGEVRWVAEHVWMHFVEGEDRASRTPKFAIGTSRDITAEMDAAEALHASEDRYRSLVDNLDEVLFSIDRSGVLTFVSPAIGRFGYSVEEVIGRPFDDFVHPDDRAQMRACFATRLAGGIPAPEALRWLDASGRVRFLRHATQLLLEGNRVIGLTGLATDVTKQRETEEQLCAAQRMEAVGRLAGGVAHDFNNMLSVILSYTELAVTSLREEDPLRADLQEIAEAARRAEGLTRQLLAFSRRQVLRLERVDVGALVVGLSKMLHRLIGEDITLEVTAEDNLFATKVDRGQTEQVVMNLVVNARDAMPNGGTLGIASRNVTLDAASAATLEVPPGEYVEMTVKDSGCGMSPSVVARIFEPFFTTKGVGKGTGLGLSLVHGIVKQSGGGIAVETAPGCGTTFRVLFPREVTDARSRASAVPVARAVRGSETILIVEDESALRNAMKRLLTSFGYKVYAAGSPGEALLICEEAGRQMSLVLTDVVMPGMSGPQLAERLAPLCPSAKIIFMTGYTDDLLEHHGMLGSGVLRKPFERSALAGTVRSALDEVSGRPLASRPEPTQAA